MRTAIAPLIRTLTPVAALIYAALTWKVTLPTAYIIANHLKLIGGAIGGLVAQSIILSKAKRAQ